MKEICPFVASKALRLHWPFSDPASHNESAQETLNNFRNVRNDISKKINDYFLSD